MNPFTAWIKAHWLMIVVGIIICWLSIGINYAVFLKPSIKVTGNGKYIQASDGLQPTVGCAIFSQYIGWAHAKTK